MKRSGQPRTDAGERPRRRLLRRLAAAAGLVLVLGLSFQLGRVEVTPLTIASSRADAVTKARALELWNQAMALSNAFLSSDFNRSLPPGQLELDEERGMAFTSGGERLPVRVWCSMLGRVAVWSGAVAQECEGGFRVGPRGGPVRSVDHSWFRTRSGAFRSADLVARTLLHELGHALHRVGNFGVARSLVNYGEIVFLWRGWSERSFERAPMAVSHEFTHWWLAGPRHEFSDEALAWPGSTEELERHLAGPELRCQHGPADEWKMSW